MNKIYVIIAFVFIFRPVMPVVEYIVNYDYISTVLCENVAKPELSCNGKCHLAKEFDKTLDHKSPIQLEKTPILFDFIPAYSYNASAFLLDIEYVIKEQVSFSYLNFYTFLLSTFVLQPPIL